MGPSSPEVLGRRARGGALAGCALGVCSILASACASRALPEVSIRARHERDARHRENRLEVLLSHTPRARPSSSPPLDLGPFVAALEACSEAPPCEAQALWLEEDERRHLWRDPLPEDGALEPRFDDVMPPVDLGGAP